MNLSELKKSYKLSVALVIRPNKKDNAQKATVKIVRRESICNFFTGAR